MFLHWCQNPQVALNPAIVVVSDVVLNHLNKILARGKSSAVIPFSFKNPPESLHRSVVDTFCHSGHTLLHLCLLQLIVKRPVCILESSVAVEQWMCVRIGFNGRIQSVKYQRIIVAVTDDIRNDSAVIQIEDCAEVQFVHRGAFVPLELCYIGQPLLVGRTCVKLPVQPILRYVLRIGGLPRTAVILVLNGGLNIQTAANTKHSLLIHIQVVIMYQVVLDTAITFVWILGMDLLYDLRNPLVFQFSGTLFATDPAVIGRSGHSQYGTR